MKRILHVVLALLLTLVCGQVGYCQIITTVAGNGTYGYSGDGGLATAAMIYWPWSVASDIAGGFYIGGWYGTGSYARVRRVDYLGTIRSIAGTGTGGFSGDGGPATAAQLYGGGVATDAAGNLYIFDMVNSRIRKVNTSGIITTFAGNGAAGYSGDGGPATAAALGNAYGWSNSGIASDPIGNVYVYIIGFNKIRKIDTAGIITTFAGTGTYSSTGDGGPATAATFGNIYGIAADASGNVFLTDWSHSRIRKINSSGIITTIAGTGTYGYSGDGGPATAANLASMGIAVDGSGNLYLADNNNNRVRKVDPIGIISTVAGIGTSGFSGDGGLATVANISFPHGVACDPAGNVYIGDYGNARVRKINNYNRPVWFTAGATANISVCQNSPGDSINTTLAIMDSDMYQAEIWSVLTPPAHGTAVASWLGISTGSAMAPHGSYYKPTAGYSGPDVFQIRVFDGFVYDTLTVNVTVNLSPGSISGLTSFSTSGYTTLSSTPGGTWSSGSPGIAAASGTLGVVAGVSAGSAPISYTLSTGCRQITTVNVFPYAGQTIITVAGNGTTGYISDGVAATSTRINLSYGVVNDASGNFYIADTWNHRVRKVNSSGVISTIAGIGTAGFGGDGSAATAATLNTPAGIAIDGSGNIYIADQNNQRIRKINTSGVISTFAGNGTAGFGGDGSAATSASLNLPTGIAIDASGNVYIADQYNNRIRKVNSSGIISTYAGNGAGTFGGDGAATAAQMYHPTGVSMDMAGNLYIADYNNQRIRKVNTSGIISTYAGTGVAGYFGDGGAAVSAKLNSPWGVNADVLGNVFIGDMSNNRIRKVNNTSGIITTVGGNGTAGFSGDLCAASLGMINTPAGVSVDGNGAVYFADGSNNRIRKIYDNHAPYFVGGHGQYTSMCQNSVDTLNLLLTIADIDPNQGESWSVGSTALHGTVTAVYSGTSTGGTATPVGLYYTSTIGYTGNDSFKIVITDCSGGTDTTLIHISVSPPASAITGSNSVCAGQNTLFVDLAGLGVWSSNNISIATVGSATGMVTGAAAGATTITFAPGASCFVTKGITVNASPAAIAGPSDICSGMPTLYTDTTPGGVWSSSSTSIFTVGSTSGSVTGISIGLATLTYFQAGCLATKNVSVNPTPPAILAPVPTYICEGDNLELLDAGTGTWSSSNPAVGSINAAGVLFGLTAGRTTITFTDPGGCYVLLPVTVNPLPAPIVGPSILCVGNSSTMSDATPGGIWTVLSFGFAATVDSFTGLLTGVSAGEASVSYTSLVTGCSVSSSVTINSTPVPITGTFRLCAGQTTNLYNIGGGGLWSSSNTSVATIGSSTGLVNGLTPGVTTISYTTPSGCAAIQQITVNANPGAITGTLTVCYGRTTMLTTGSSGIWSSGSPIVATVGSTTGMVTGVIPGNTLITFSNASGCTVTAVVTVNTSPGPITGTLSACPTGNSLLSNALVGGSWSSGTTSVAGISTGGLVTGAAPGTTTITYSLGAGCSSTATFTVNNLPSVITGPLTACQSSTVTLSDLTPGGTWVSSALSVATVGSLTGVVTGSSPGLTVITYAVPGAGCYRTASFTINALPAVITGGPTVCQGSTITLTDATTGGVWTSSILSVATVSGISGTVNGILAGVTNINYTLTTGCQRSKTITVNPLPAFFTVTGGGAYCAGGTGLHVGLSGSVTGTSYQLYVGGIATGSTVAGTGGVLDFGLQTAAGTYTITATTVAGCTATMTSSAVIVINPLPSPISGASAVCAGSSATLSSSPTGGSWSSGTTTTGTIGAMSGVFSGIAIGTTIITYTLPTGCYTTRTETVSTAPTAIIGASTVCNGASITLTDGVGGGLWYTSGAASVGSTTGVVTGTATGTAIITYTLGTGCTVTKSITVNPSPAAITGTLSLCAGRTTTLGDATIGGTWGGGTMGIAAIGSSSGLVTATSAGTTTVSYTVSGCSTTAVVTVYAIPVDVSTITTLCVGSFGTLAMTPTGGVWSSTATNVTVNSTTGTVTGIATGAATITYTSGTCQSTRTITVISTPVISGVSGLCVGSSAVLTTSISGGSWTSSNTAIVTITSTGGVMTGMTAGNATITYAAGGCTGTRNVTVSAGPAPITGASSVCAGSSTTLCTTTGGGTWTSSNTSIARVGSLTGTVTGVAAGSVTITYSLGSGCVVTWPMTVNAIPGVITGSMSVCISGTSVLASSGGAGVWSSSNTGIATIGSSTGLFTGVAAGTTTISYTIGTLPGCSATATVTVNTPPSAITGPSAICMGSSAALSTASTGGTWSSSNTIIATIGSLTGIVSGVNTGFAVITYSLGAGCIATKIVNVNLPPPGISGASRVCVGASTTLTDPASGGVWRSSNTGVAAVGSLSGVVSGVSGGVVTISYQVSEGCVATYPVTVNSVPAITGLRSLCAWGDTVTIHDADGTGIYSSTLITVANLGGGNARVTSSVPGSGTITYTLSSGCTTNAPATVNPIPGAITGSYSICLGSTVTLTSSPGGGSWSSGATGIATVGSVSGLVSGISAGSARITYTLPTGCKTDTAIRVNTLPAGITGWGSVITVGTSSTYSDATPGGIWTSSNPAIATIGMTTGTVYGVSPGVVTISYTVGTSCSATRVLTVRVLPGTGR